MLSHLSGNLYHRRQLACDTPHFRSTADAFLQITRREGIASLYNGLSPTLAMAVPATVLYFTTYDTIRERFRRRLSPDREWLAPVFAGSSARTIATTVISPLELVRTIMMAERSTGTSVVNGGMVGVVRRVGAEIAFTGPKLLFRGLIPSLWKDVPFSAVYWLGYEQLRGRLLARHQWPGKSLGHPPDLPVVFQTSFVAGACSGTFAALLTTPFDVIKTRQQVFLFDRTAAVPSTLSTVRPPTPLRSGSSSCCASCRPYATRTANLVVKSFLIGRSYIAQASQVVGEAGWTGLFAGLGPRLMKVAPACAIMIGSYEFGKAYFRQQSSG